MIALDSSALIAYLEGGAGRAVEAVEVALAERQACLPPVVLTEVLSDPALPADVAVLLGELPLLAVEDGYWERAGKLRARLLAKGLKARLADSLIAQSCIDHGVTLVATDSDFRQFARLGLKLVP